MRIALVLTLVAACSSNPPPSCAQATAHYYGAGCTFYDGTVSPPAPVPEATFVVQCQMASETTPANCVDEQTAFLECLDSVVTGKCDCSQTQMALADCH